MMNERRTGPCLAITLLGLTTLTLTFDAQSPVAQELLQSENVVMMSEDAPLVDGFLQNVEIVHVYNDQTGTFEEKIVSQARSPMLLLTTGLALGAVTAAVVRFPKTAVLTLLGSGIVSAFVFVFGK